MPGLFSIFNTAKSGLFSQQTAINVTSHNIANANTDGYSRQRADLVTTPPYTMPSMNSPASAGQLGTGVTVASIDRIRDIFLDYQVRVQMGVSGQYTAKDKYLTQVENALNEPTDTGISSLIQQFFSSWQDLSGSTENTSTVAQQAYQLTNSINSTYSQLTSIKDNTNTEIKNLVVDINGMLSQISKLNQQIKDVKISGQNPNDLMDSRDLLLDQLSSEFGITINQRSLDGIDVTTSSDGVDGTAPIGTDGNPLNIVQSDNPDSYDVASFSYINSIDPNSVDASGNGTYTVVYYKKGDTLTDANNKVTLTVTMTADEAKQLDESRVLWADSTGMAYKDTNGDNKIATDGKKLDGTEPVDFKQLMLFKPPTGELKGYMAVQQNVDDYQDTLNKFAKALALSVNSIISQSSTWVADGDNAGSHEGGINNFFVNADPASSTYGADDEKNINAGNITVNVAILNDPSKIKTATKYDSKGNSLNDSTDGNRAAAIAQLANSLMNIQSVTSTSTRDELVEDIFSTNDKLNNVYSVGSVTGGSTIDNYFDDLVNKVGMQEQEAKTQVSNEATQLANYTQSRESVSGVSMDEEMTNLIQFQHCYQANAKMISTIDELLDVVVNGLKK
ncbi:flagellar hook-associated protein FlgK [Clostridium sp. WLY-B-L2]|uniref:Flagellar hook-associated protein 1 n=1 Tax=Clostridium aromativorans TaxID=2836848 RepID=A0ABS8N274_9CLOT|nr:MULTISPECIES: flagellar hook-associated protein FlgK [Clostridium]KAA8678164.1 flagellar hook-associated protein FlgK [Clostridium sp. HV4-5-A1G]MCC9293888.1 flagellar hook-associated protein FlgK [Clostridium aromativorans]